DTAHVAQRHGGSAVGGGVRDREVYFVLRRDAAFEGNTVGLGDQVPVPIFDEVETFSLPESRFQVGRPADQAELAPFADAAVEQRLDENLFVTIDQSFDVIRGCGRAQSFRDWEVDVSEQRCAVEQSGDFHVVSPDEI